MMMEKKKKMMIVAVALTLLVMISSNTLLVESDASDCYDACSTGCVNPDPRLMVRCDRKCQIRCGPSDIYADCGTSSAEMVAVVDSASLSKAYKATENLLD